MANIKWTLALASALVLTGCASEEYESVPSDESADIGVGTVIEMDENKSSEKVELSCDDPAGCLVSLEVYPYAHTFINWDTDEMRDHLTIKLGSFTVGAILADAEFGMYYTDALACSRPKVMRRRASFEVALTQNSPGRTHSLTFVKGDVATAFDFDLTIRDMGSAN